MAWKRKAGEAQAAPKAAAPAAARTKKRAATASAATKKAATATAKRTAAPAAAAKKTTTTTTTTTAATTKKVAAASAASTSRAAGARRGRLFLLGHSAGSTPEQPHMQRFKQLLETLGEVVMVRFKKPYFRMEWLAKQFLEQLQQANAEQYDEVYLAGVSMGSRVALIMRNNHRAELPPNIRGAIAFSYPLFGQEKGDTRESPLIDMVAGDRVLLCNGDRDDMVNFRVLQGILDRTPATSTVLRLSECDHSLKLVKKKQRKSSSAAAEEKKAEDEDDDSGLNTQEDVDAAILQAVREFVETSGAASASASTARPRSAPKTARKKA